jgi:RNA polymerase sigma-70 factor, ECF subfamily
VDVLERDLVVAAKRGDRKAFKALAERYYPRIYRMLLAMTHKEDLALDLAQDTFVKALQGIGNFEMGSSFYTWLYRIAHNVFLDRYRRDRTAGAPREFDDAVGSSVAEGAPLGRPLEPSRAVEAQERLDVVREALDQLKPEHREILVLREIEDQSYEEIAEALGLKMGTVMSRLFTARMKLREILEARLGRHG